MSPKSILIACMPKSGSTFLANTIANLHCFAKYSLVPAYGFREQEIEEARILSFNENVLFNRKYNKEAKSKFFVAQHHVRNSKITDEICERHKIFRVILCRNLKDIIFSLKDHFVDESIYTSSARVPSEYFSWEEDKKEEFIVDFIMPWYINFFIGWSKYNDDFTKIIWYEDLIANKVETISSILKAAEFTQINEDDIIAAVNTKPKATDRRSTNRFNKGISGRGKNLSEIASAKLLKLLDYYKLDDSILELLY